MLAAVRAFFSTPTRQAMGWAAIGMIGLAFAASGVLLFLDDGGSVQPASFVPSGVTATATGSASLGASPSAAASGTATATPPRVGLTATAFAQMEAAQTATVLAVTPSPAATTVPTIAPAPTSTPFTGEDDDDEPDDEGPGPEPTPAPVETVVAATPTNPPVSYAYCESGGGGTPPSAIFGTVTIDGAAAPAGTNVTIAFDGVPALSGTVSVKGNAAGYRFLYGTGGGSCTNRVGASISIIVDATAYSAPVTVGGGVATLFNVGD